jgi:DNA replication and repair protein RecF
MTPCWIQRLSLTRFRSHRASEGQFDARPVALIGANGIGKTNVLEALSFLTPGRGLRNARLEEVPSQGSSGGWAVAVILRSEATGCDETRLGVGVTADALDRRQVRINGATASGVDLLGRLVVLWLTPDQDRLFTDSASMRRRFFDRLTLSLYPDHAVHVSRYETALRERNRLLSSDERPDPAWLDALEADAAAQGVAIAAARRDTLQALQAMIAQTPESPFPRALLALEGDIDARVGLEPALTTEDWLRAAFAEARQRDAAAGRALVGPHRSDLVVTHAAKGQAAASCSTGEQKALLIGLSLAQTRLVAQASGRRPLLLLDEVAAHLDATRRAALFDIITDLGVQAWMTGTDVALFEALADRAQQWTITEAGLTPLTN